MSTVTLYTKPGCHLCDDARAVLHRIRDDVAFELIECDISVDAAVHRAYFDRIPVVSVDGEELCEYFVEERALRDVLTAHGQ